MQMEIIEPGLLTTVQDLGRIGHAAEGWRTCGCCDAWSAELANLMAGNDAACAVLETASMALSVRFTGTAVAAFAGVDVAGTVNEQSVRMAFPLLLESGDVLRIRVRRGLRAYLAVHGGVDVPSVLGSRATDLACRVGGLEGRCLRAGDWLNVKDVDAMRVFPALHRRASYHTVLSSLTHPMDRQTVPVKCLRAMPGPQSGLFTDDARQSFTAGTYTLTAQCDRMGCRLSGPALKTHTGSTDILSDAIVEGSVQVPSSGQPMVLLADHQTTGGYAKIAVVAPADLPILAQLMPGDKVRFRWINRKQALLDYRSEKAALAQWRTLLQKEE